MRKIETQFKHEQEKQREWEERIRKEQALAGVRFNTQGKPRGSAKKKGCKHCNKKPQGKPRGPQAECKTGAPPVCAVPEELVAPKATGSPSTSVRCDGGFGRLIHHANPVGGEKSMPFVQKFHPVHPVYLRRPLTEQLEQLQRELAQQDLAHLKDLDRKDRARLQEGVLQSLEKRDALPPRQCLLHQSTNSPSLEWLDDDWSQRVHCGSDAG